MKIIALALVALCVAVSTTRASWAAVSLEDFVKGKDLIVVGEIQRIDRAPKSKYAHDTAFIKVERVLKSSLRETPQVGAEVSLPMPSINNETQISTDTRYDKGQRGIWILRFQDGKLHADHPMSLQPLSEEQNVVAAIKGK